MLKRYVDGAGGEPFFQKRVPDSAPEWLQTATVTFPSGRTARELLPNDPAHLVWALNLGVIDWNPWPVRRQDLDHPDELRVDLDPTPEASWDDVRQVAICAGEVLHDHGLTGFPKTSGSRGIHINVRITPERGFDEVRRAAIALAREIERRVPELATSKWWKEERHGVFVDYNQNARDRTVASAYSVRPTPDARVSTPLRWDEVADVEPGELRLDTVRERVAQQRRPERRDRRERRARWTPCSSSPAATRRTDSATLRGRRTSASSAASPSAFSRAARDRIPTSRPRSALSHLAEQALPRRLVGAPAQDLRAVTDPSAALVVELDLDHQLGPQRDPLELLLVLPAARVAVAALTRRKRREPLDQLTLLGGPQTRGVPDDAQRSRRRRRGRGSATRRSQAPSPACSRRPRRRSSAQA